MKNLIFLEIIDANEFLETQLADAKNKLGELQEQKQTTKRKQDVEKINEQLNEWVTRAENIKN